MATAKKGKTATAAEAQTGTQSSHMVAGPERDFLLLSLCLLDSPGPRAQTRRHPIGEMLVDGCYTGPPGTKV